MSDNEDPIARFEAWRGVLTPSERRFVSALLEDLPRNIAVSEELADFLEHENGAPHLRVLHQAQPDSSTVERTVPGRTG